MWLRKEGETRYAIVHKSRLSWFDWGDETELRQRPLLRVLLPKRLEALEPGQSYPELIAHYLTHPERDYGALNAVRDPAQRPLSEDERALLDVHKAEAEAEALRLRLDEATQTGKRRLMAELKQAGLKDLTGLDIANAFRALDIEQYTLSQHEDTLRRLVAHFRPGEPG